MDTAMWYIRESFQKNCAVVLEDLKRTDASVVISCTCVRILEELLTAINSCVLNFECNKVPLRNRTYVYATI
jgi:hypothetical protein